VIGRAGPDKPDRLCTIKLLPAFLGSELPIAAAGTRAAALFARTRFVYGEGATANLFAVKGSEGGVSLRFVIHGDERKTARFAGHAVHHQRDFANLAVLFKKILKIVFRGLKREISNV
jgi:hypothetical protein